jgi:SAM-dependent methyltransferase
MKRYYDPKNKRLIYIGESATEQFWDSHWKTENFRKAVTSTPNSWVARVTKKYLAEGSEVLEGGCGQANHVFALTKQGYNAVGLDFAPQTVRKLQENVPEIQIVLGDVRELPFENSSFDGYWSLGVIEHFWDGYDAIASEMARVVRGGGLLFLTFPCISFLRRLKAKKNHYPVWKGEDNEPEGFYQFALSPSTVEEKMSGFGFTLVHEKGLDGVKGLKDEVESFNKPLQFLYDSPSLMSRILKRLINGFTSDSFGHSKLMIFRKIL